MKFTHRALIAGLLGLVAIASAQEVTYPVFENDKIPIQQLKSRRDAIKGQLGPGGVAVFFTNPERNRNNDCDFKFRGDSNFLYLTGFEEPDSVLIISTEGFVLNGKKVTEVLLVNENDPMSLTWLGYRMGSKDAKTLLGMESVVSNTSANFDAVMKSIEAIPNLHFWNASVPPDPTGDIGRMIQKWTNWQTSHKGWPAPSGSVFPMLAKLRVQKSPEELALLRKAAQASAMGHREVMRSVKPGNREFELQATVEYLFTRNGCESVGYNSIVGSGPNGCILHYEDNRRLIQNGDLICMDAAGEYHGYSADVTRTFPANGKFSPTQRAVYEVVLAAQTAGIKECKAGNSFGAAGRAAERVITEGLMKLGITKSPAETRIYLPHGVSHYIGLDVHDAHGDNTLRPGYVLTVEPGIYIREGSKCDPKFWNIGIRIEDDILVTDKGPENLSAGAPRTVAEIESLMKQQGIGKRPAGQ